MCDIFSMLRNLQIMTLASIESDRFCFSLKIESEQQAYFFFFCNIYSRIHSLGALRQGVTTVGIMILLPQLSGFRRWPSTVFLSSSVYSPSSCVPPSIKKATRKPGRHQGRWLSTSPWKQNPQLTCRQSLRHTGPGALLLSPLSLSVCFSLITPVELWLNRIVILGVWRRHGLGPAMSLPSLTSRDCIV